MKLYVNRGGKTFEATIESVVNTQTIEEGGTFGSKRTYRDVRVVNHVVHVVQPVGDALVQIIEDEDTQTVLDMLYTAIEGEIDGYERNNR
jgi:hypothetical protein